jgi:YD repeat-containing protein
VKRYGYTPLGSRKFFSLNRSGKSDIFLWYIYDELNRLTEVRESGIDGQIIVKYEYDLNSNRIKKYYLENDIETTYSHNYANLITSLTVTKGNTLISGYSYTYSPDGNQLTKIDILTNRTVSYKYDRLARLIKEIDPLWNTIIYEYDNNSNRSKIKVSGLDNYTTAYEYDSNNKLITETRVEKDKKKTEIYYYQYDKNGNQEKRSRKVLKKATSNDPSPVIRIVQEERPDGKVTVDSRRYNGINQTVRIDRDALQTYSLYRPDGLRHSKEVRNRFKRNTSVTTVHIWDNSDIVLEINQNRLIKGKYIRAAGLVFQAIGTNRYYYLTNAHGDVVRQADQNGNLTPEYIYDSFGN